MNVLHDKGSSDTQHMWIRRLLPGLLLVILSAYAFIGIERTPFHPDENTQLFMSSDFDALLSRPLSLAWSPSGEKDLKQRYRELDAPLTRYLLGLGRSLFHIQAPAVDWDWGKSWEENRQSGALPDRRLLFAGRLAVALLIPFSLLLTYSTAKQLGGAACGMFAMLLLGMNALVLLHTRRAMAEGALLFGISLFIWSLPKAGRFPWLAGLSAAVAYNAKQSALALVPVGLLAVCWLADSAGRQRAARASLAALLYLLVFALLTLALNPLYWNSPVQAARASWLARQDLTYRQAADRGGDSTDPSINAPGKRIVAILANLYVMPPAFAEVGNYREETATAEAAYLAFPGSSLLRGFAGGGIMLFLTLAGLVTVLMGLNKTGLAQRRTAVLLLLASLSQAAFLLIAVPLPWQRYILPLVPFASIWCAYSLSPGAAHMFRRKGSLETAQARGSL